MGYEADGAMENRLRDFLYERVGRRLARREQRESFATYAYGIVGEGERKSVEPIAARAAGAPLECERVQARLLNFLRDSPWDDQSVRREAASYVIEALQRQEPVTVCVGAPGS